MKIGSRYGRPARQRGFSVIETIVAIGLFTSMMLIIVGALLSMSDASRKARGTRVALDNVGAAIDYMSREIRLGAFFHCENATTIANPPITTPRACPYGGAGGILLAFEHAGGVLSNAGDQYVFWLQNGRIWRSTQSLVNPEPLTAPEIVIQDMRFYVDGVNTSLQSPANADQPKITLFIQGLAGGGRVKTQSPFTAQVTMSARTPNVPPP